MHPPSPSRLETARSSWGAAARLLTIAFAVSALVGCGRDDAARRVVAERGTDAGAEPPVVAQVAQREAHVADGGTNVVEPAHVERFRVPGDVMASVVRSTNAAAPTTVFLPGICSNAYAYLLAFPEAARRQGGVVAIEGDQPCGNLAGFRSFSWDATKLHQRLEAAVAAAGLAAVPREGLTLVGYSQGAALGEQLAQRWPGRYARVVLIGAPTDPSAARFAGARAVVTMSCSRDVPWKMKEATSRFLKAGIPSTYVEMPNCTHGNITDGDRTFDAAFDWLRANARPPAEDAKPQPLVGE